MDETEKEIELRKNKKKKLTKLIVISIIIYSITIVFHGLFIYFFETKYDLIISDQVVFYNRGIGILKGDIPYRDFPTRAAPLSPYLWAPIILFSIILTGDYSLDYISDTSYISSPSMMFSSYVFRVFFSICLIISAILLYKLLESRNNKHAFWISLGYSINPFFLYLVSFWGSDECIVPLLILLPIYFLEKKKYTIASIFIIIGAGLKYFPIILIPLILIYREDMSKGALNILFILVGITVVYLPFYFIDPEAFLKQFYHPLDRDNNQGIATLFDKFLVYDDSLNLALIFLILAIIFVGLFSIVLILKKDKWQIEKTIAIFMPFLILFPKIQFSYFVIIYPFLFITLFKRNLQLTSAIVLICSGVGGAAANYILGYDGTKPFLYTVSWITTVILYLSMISFLLLIFLENTLRSIIQRTKV